MRYVPAHAVVGVEVGGEVMRHLPQGQRPLDYENERKKQRGHLRAHWIMKRAASKGSGRGRKERKEGSGDVPCLYPITITSHPIYGSFIASYLSISSLMMNLGISG